MVLFSFLNKKKTTTDQRDQMIVQSADEFYYRPEILKKTLILVIKKFSKNHRIMTIEGSQLIAITAQIDQALKKIRKSDIVGYYQNPISKIYVSFSTLRLYRKKSMFAIRQITLSDNDSKAEVNYFTRNNDTQYEQINLK